MKNIKSFLLLAGILLFLFSCKKDGGPQLPYDPYTPVVKLSNEIVITTLGSDFVMEADIQDSVGLKSFTIRYDDWYLYNTVSLADSGYPKKYHVKYKFKMPDTAANKIHSILLTATNVGNNQSAAQYKVLLNTDFPKMYLTESTDPASLTNNLFGVPMVINKIGSYSFEAIYYSKAANSNIWFIPGKTSFKPIMYGIDPTNSSKLTGDYASAKPIIIPGIGYYKIDFNTLTLTYSIQQLPTPDPAKAFPQVAIAGMGFYDYPNMYWQNTLPDIILMDKDPVNPYLFTKTVRLGIPPGQTYNVAEFIFTTNNGWTNFWRFNNGTNPEYTVPNGGSTGGDFPITNTPVTYKVTFDSYINRSKFEKQ